MAQEDKIQINLLIGKQTQRIIIPHEQEAIYRRAAESINMILARYETAYPQQSTERHLTNVTLQFAVHALQLEEDRSTAPFCESIATLTEEIEAILKKADGAK